MDLRNICRPLRASPVAPSRDLYLNMPSFRCLSVDFAPGQHAPSTETLASLLLG